LAVAGLVPLKRESIGLGAAFLTPVKRESVGLVTLGFLIPEKRESVGFGAAAFLAIGFAAAFFAGDFLLARREAFIDACIIARSAAEYAVKLSLLSGFLILPFNLICPICGTHFTF
jgi:hypothetical protein